MSEPILYSDSPYYGSANFAYLPAGSFLKAIPTIPASEIKLLGAIPATASNNPKRQSNLDIYWKAARGYGSLDAFFANKNVEDVKKDSAFAYKFRTSYDYSAEWLCIGYGATEEYINSLRDGNYINKYRHLNIDPFYGPQTLDISIESLYGKDDTIINRTFSGPLTINITMSVFARFEYALGHRVEGNKDQGEPFDVLNLYKDYNTRINACFSKAQAVSNYTQKLQHTFQIIHGRYCVVVGNYIHSSIEFVNAPFNWHGLGNDVEYVPKGVDGGYLDVNDIGGSDPDKVKLDFLGMEIPISWNANVFPNFGFKPNTLADVPYISYGPTRLEFSMKIGGDFTIPLVKTY